MRTKRSQSSLEYKLLSDGRTQIKVPLKNPHTQRYQAIAEAESLRHGGVKLKETPRFLYYTVNYDILNHKPCLTNSGTASLD